MKDTLDNGNYDYRNCNNSSSDNASNSITKLPENRKHRKTARLNTTSYKPPITRASNRPVCFKGTGKQEAANKRARTYVELNCALFNGADHKPHFEILPEHKLLVAVLNQAIYDLLVEPTNGRYNHQHYMHSFRWLFVDKSSKPGSARWLCDLLNVVSLDLIREKVKLIMINKDVQHG